REAAELLEAAGAPPARVAHQLLEGDRAADAVPWLERAARAARDVAAYADALGFAETALRHADEAARRELLPLRADLLFATGDPAAATAYEEAIAAGARGAAELRTRQARALLAAGDVAAATATLAGVRTRSKADRARLAVTGGIVAWFRGDLEAAQRGIEEGLPLAREAGLVQETMEATQLRACLAHSKGDWGGRVQSDLVETLRHSESAALVFDAHVCLAEWVLTSGEPYDELAEAAREILAAAERSGARRAHAFAATVLGEAELLAGRVQIAAGHLREAAEISREIGTHAGESLACLRLAEATLADGAGDEAARLLDESIGLARGSTLPDHLLYLAFAPKIRATADPEEALALVDEAEGLLDIRPRCPFCPIGFWVAGAIACARAGRLERSRAYLDAVERTALLWPGGPWPAAAAEARAELALAQGAHEDAARLLTEAAAGFARAGQPLAAARVEEAARKVPGRPAA
ncbi:MAG: SARP family transcriptional regulator, partial [Gaiellaceae bacterium]